MPISIRQGQGRLLDSGTIAFDSAVLAGSLIIASVNFAVTSVSDDRGNSYTIAYSSAGFASFFCPSSISGARVLIVNGSSTDPSGGLIILEELTGVGLSSSAVVDGISTDAVIDITIASTGNFTTTQNGDFIYAAFLTFDPTSTTIAGSGFSKIYEFAGIIFDEYRVQDTAGTLKATMSGFTTSPFIIHYGVGYGITSS
jgi:hypothetical protein